jgi:thymidine kinase
VRRTGSALAPDDTIVVGAAEQFEARCRDCHETGPDVIDQGSFQAA